jgi:hypothetical protein
MTNRFVDLSEPAPVARDEEAPSPVSVPVLPAQVAHTLGSRRCLPDAVFDHFLSDAMRVLSSQHWTPLAVVARAAQWLDECNIRTVVDVGAGAGKFCVAAALASRCHFTGLEHRGHLVTCARSLARTFGVEHRVHFIPGALGDVALPSVDAYYLYNPFEENVLEPDGRIDDAVELSAERLARDLAAVNNLLTRAPGGTYVLVYNGIGAKLPPSYGIVRTDRELPNALCLWRKSMSRIRGRSHRAELGGAVGAA